MARENRGRHNKVKYLFINTVNALFEAGKGKSKHQAFQESYDRDRTRQSQVIHSHSTHDTYIEVVSKFGDFLYNEKGIKYESNFRELSKDEVYACLDEYFEKQKAAGFAKRTLQKHISALNKTLSAIDPKLKECFTPDNRAKWRDGKEKQECDRYNNSDKILENLRKIDETSYAIARIQQLTGARVGDVKKLVIDEENKKVIFPRSKGGRDRSVYFDRFPEQFETVKECKEILDRALEEKRFSEIRKNEYYNNLKKACKKADELYHGSHAFRFEFAQNRHEVISQWSPEEQEAYYRRILEERCKSEKEINKAMESVKERDAVAEAIVSEELGHSRLDISRYYLKIRAK
jgi:integrase